jgi:hypothetical protein
VQEAIHGPRHIGKATPDNGLVERGDISSHCLPSL